MRLKALKDFGTGSVLNYSDGQRNIDCEVVSVSFGKAGSIVIQLKNLITNKISTYNGYELPNGFTVKQK